MLNVVFLDDDPNLISGLKRSLRSVREKWDVFFYSVPEDALEKMNAIKPDVVVSDYKMPSMNGLDFMKIVKELFPEAKRIILSGHYELSDFDDRDIVHLIIAKPCEPHVLIHEIEAIAQRS